jgi:hypothetical protein
VGFEQVAGLADRIGEVVGTQLRTICRWLRAVARAGLVMGLLVWCSLLPLLLELPGWWAAAAIVGLGALPIWLAWSVRRHVAALEEVYTNTDVLRHELSTLGDSAGQVKARFDALQTAPTGRIGRLRWAFGYLNGVRSTWSDLGLVGRVARLAEPVNPARLAATSWKVLALAVTVLVGPVVILLAFAVQPFVD